MSNLLNDSEGRNALLTAQRFLLQRRLSRFFKRNLVIDVEQWSKGLADFDLSTLLGNPDNELNDAHDDGIRDLYRLLGTIGGLQNSIADTDVYVNGTAGSDITGTGSSSRPYQSLWFLSFLPRRIDHIYRIRITGTVTASEGITIDNDFGAGGCLSFIGVGAATEVYSALAATLGAPPTGPNFFNAAWAWTTSVAPSSPVYETFVQATSGAAINKAVPVDRVFLLADPLSVPFDGIGTRDCSFSFSAGDTVRYIIPTPVLSIPDQMAINIKSNGAQNIPASIDSRMSHVNFANLSIDFDGLTGNEKRLIIDSTVDVGFWFVRAKLANGNGPMAVVRSRLNTSNPVDDQLGTIANSGVANITHTATGFVSESAGLMLYRGGGTPYSDGHNPVVAIQNDAQLWSFACNAPWEIDRSNPHIFDCSAMILDVANSNPYLKQVALWGETNAATPAIITIRNSRIDGDRVFFGSALLCWLSTSSEIIQGILFGNDGNIGLHNYLLDATGLTRMFISSGWAGSPGVLADIQWSNTGPATTSAFPAVQTTVTDTLGQEVTRGTA